MRYWTAGLAMVAAAMVLVALALLAPGEAAGAAPAAAGDSSLFPFAISYDAPANATNISGWLRKPAGADGFVRPQGGRLVSDRGPVRFFATNLCFEACFPERQQAERLAARLARFGINCVRMHHMDSHSIWGRSPNKLTIDPEKLARLDYLIYQLKQHGIYVNLNLHVSRTLGPQEGFPNVDGRPKYDKGLGNFEPRMIEAQRQYARQLLTHVNPHTGRPYTDEPAVAFVEISNEDALFTVWGRSQLETLPEPYATTYRQLWNAWLRNKYGNTEKLRAAWNTGTKPLGREMLRNGNFAAPLADTWFVERDDQTEVSWSVEAEGPEGARSLRMEVTRQGREPWRPQLSQAGFELRKGEPYTLEFSLRSDAARSVGVNCMMAHAPWQRLGLSESVRVGLQWQRYRFTFVPEQDDRNARITFTGLEPGRYELAAVSLRPGGIQGLGPEERLEDDSVPVLSPRRSGRTPAARRDFVDFLWDTERDYWWGMYRFLKNELGLKSLVSGTQLNYSPVHIQAGLDYIDAHAYWNHPSFPGRPWDPRNWWVRNLALVNSPAGTLGGLAVRRVAGLPFTVSEYNHPAPNEYAAEGLPMLAAVAAFQDWDGIFSFTYSHDTDFEPARITGFFDIKGDTAKLAHLPACAAMFLRGDVKPGGQLVLVPLSPQREKQVLYETLNVWNLNAQYLGFEPRLAVLRRVGLDIQPAAASPAVADELPAELPELRSDTGQIRWNVPEPGKGHFIVDTQRSKLFTGFTRPEGFELGNLRLHVGQTRLGWATVSLVCIDGEGFDQPGRVLVAATGVVKNTGAELARLAGDRVTLADRWGSAPILCEGVPATIRLPLPASRVRYYPLDPSGARGPALEADEQDGQAVIKLDPQHRTVWYEIEIR